MEKEITLKELQEYLRKEEEPYIVVTEEYLMEMEKRIEFLIKIGYEPIGDIVVKNGQYHQVMII